MALVQPEKSGGLRGAVADLLIVVGTGLVTYGTWQVYPPASFIVFGAIILIFGVAGAAVKR